MPPPKPSTEGRRDRQVSHEMGQIVRALEVEGPQMPDDLARLTGARFGDPQRFQSALSYSMADGLVVRLNDGKLSAV